MACREWQRCEPVRPIDANALKRAIRMAMDGRGVSAPDDALYVDELMDLIDWMPVLIYENAKTCRWLPHGNSRMMYDCENCGYVSNVKKRYCSECGTKLINE